MRLRLQHPMCCSACASLTTNWWLNPRQRGNRCGYDTIGVSSLLSALRSFRQGDILQLPDALSGHSEFIADFFESFRFVTVQSESLEDNLPLAVVQHLQKLAKLVAHVLVSEQLERRLRLFITDDLAKCG